MARVTIAAPTEATVERPPAEAAVACSTQAFLETTDFEVPLTLAKDPSKTVARPVLILANA